MPKRYESLQSLIARKMDPVTFNRLLSPIKQDVQKEMAKHIQRTFRTKNLYATYRDGKKMSTAAMRRQLIDAWSSSISFQDFLDNKFLHTLRKKVESMPEKEKIKLLINNSGRDLLIGIYNDSWSLWGDDEDVTHIGNPMYFPQSLVTGADSDSNSDSDDEAGYRKSKSNKRKSNKRKSNKRKSNKRKSSKRKSSKRKSKKSKN